MIKDDNLEKLGLNIRRIRKKEKMTQEKLGIESGLDRSYIGGIERGERNLSILNMLKIAKALHIDPPLLLENFRLEDL